MRHAARQDLGPRTLILKLILTMSAVVVTSGGVAMFLLYETAVDAQLARLRESVRNRARLIEAMARHDAGEPPRHGTPAADTLSQVVDAHQHSPGFGHTGEFVLARRVGDQIVFVLSQRHGDRNVQRPVSPLPVDRQLHIATPMRRALTGASGASIGVDYRGATVLAAYEPVAELDMGLVAKIDLAEIRAPFIRAAALGGVAAFFAIVVGAFFFVRTTLPLVRRVRESEAYSRTIVESAADGILTVDEEGRITSFNPAACAIFGYSRDEAVGLSVTQLMPAFEPERSDAVVSGVRRDGSEIPLEVSVSTLAKPSRSRYSLFVRDVSERHRLEAELRHAQKMEAVGTLASGVAHDFNNLLMGIAGTANVALKTTAGESSTRRQLEAIKGAALGGASITRQLLTFSRRDERALATFDVNGLIAENEEMLRRIVGANIELVVTLSTDPLCIRGDRGELDQILFNVVGNARHAMQTGGTLEIKTCRATRGDRCFVHLAVSDTGSGMTEETKARIFEPFFTTKEPGTGTGLGLSSTYGIVRRNGGHIDVESAPGQGTTFHLFWPEARDATEEQAPSLPADSLHGSETVLLVEDERLVRESVQHDLEGAGYRVLAASGAGDALQALRAHGGKVDLLLTDFVLPDRSGAELAGDVRQLRSEIAVLYMSAYSNEKLIADGQLSRGAPFLQKPFGDTALLAAVREALESGGAASRDGIDDATRDRAILLVEDEELSRMALGEVLQEAGYRVFQAASGGEAEALYREQSATIALVATDLGLPDVTCTELLGRLARIAPIRAVLYLSGRDREDTELKELLELPHSAFVQKPFDLDEAVFRVQEMLADGSGRGVEGSVERARI